MAGEDDVVAVVEDAEALARDVAERALAVTGSSPSACPGHVDMRAVGVELVALVLEQLDIAEQVEQLRLRLIEAGVGGELEPVAARGGDVALGPFERDEVVELGLLPRDFGGDDEGPVVAVDAGVVRIDHAADRGVAEDRGAATRERSARFRLEDRGQTATSSSSPTATAGSRRLASATKRL